MAKDQQFEHPTRGHVALLAYDSVNDRFQVVHVDASGLLQVDVAAVADRQANAHGYDGAAWRKLPMLWGYTDRYAEAEKNEDCSTGANVLAFTEVPPGEVWVVNSICWVNTVSACSIIGVTLAVGATTYTVTIENTPVADEYTLVTPGMVLKAGDALKVSFYSCILHDKVYAWALGYKMTVNM